MLFRSGIILLLRSCNSFRGETFISIHASWLSIQSSILQMPPPHVSRILFSTASKASFISMNALASIHTNSINSAFFVRHENTGSKSHGQKDVIKRHQMSSDVRDRSVWGSKLKEWLKVCFFTGKTVFLSRTICPKIKKQEIWN